MLERALALVESAETVLDTYPLTIESDETPLVCAIPPRFDATLAPAVDEAQGLRAAYERSLQSRRVTEVGRVIGADEVTEALAVLHQWAEGASWKETPLPGKITIAVCHDIRAYYSEAALQLATGPAPDARSVEAWFYEETEAGKAMLAARAAIRDQGAPFPFWFYMAPAHR